MPIITWETPEVWEFRVPPPRERSLVDEVMEALCDPGVWRELGHVNDLIRELNMEGW